MTIDGVCSWYSIRIGHRRGDRSAVIAVVAVLTVLHIYQLQMTFIITTKAGG